MARQIDNYVIVIGSTVQELSNKVLTYLKYHSGYQLLGGVAVDYKSNAPNVYLQTIVKYQN